MTIRTLAPAIIAAAIAFAGPSAAQDAPAEDAVEGTAEDAVAEDGAVSAEGMVEEEGAVADEDAAQPESTVAGKDVQQRFEFGEAGAEWDGVVVDGISNAGSYDTVRTMTQLDASPDAPIFVRGAVTAGPSLPEAVTITPVEGSDYTRIDLNGEQVIFVPSGEGEAQVRVLK